MTQHKEQIFNDGDAYFKQLLLDIQAASSSIEIEIYLFKFDDLGKKIIEELILAAKRKVKIRILVDGIGSPNWKGSIVKKLDLAGINSKIFHPLPWSLSQFNRAVSQKPWVENLVHFIMNINSRTHRKIILIDNYIAHIGSRNFDKCHLSRSSGGLNWRDTNIKLTNAPIDALKQSFEKAWHGNQQIIEKIQTKFLKSIDIHSVIRLNDSLKQRRTTYKTLLKKITTAKKKIWITNAYFIPNHFLLKKITEAAKRGIDVRLILPQKSDVTVIPWVTEIFYETLHKNGVRIFEYQPSMLHAKTIIIDDWVLIGTSNLNHRSLLHDLEVDVMLTTSTSKKQMSFQFRQDLNQCQEIINPNQQKRPWFKRIIGRFIISIKFFI